MNERIPNIADNMREEVFLEHLHLLHFIAGEPDTGDQNLLRKVKPLLSSLLSKMWSPGMSLALDECSIAYKGRLGIVQFNPTNQQSITSKFSL